MAHTYETDPFDNISKVRLKIGDTDISPTTDAQFSDEEINVFLAEASNSILLAASYALEAWAATVTGQMKTERIGDYSYGRDEAAAKTALAKKYREEDALKPSSDWASLDLTSGSAITGED